MSLRWLGRGNCTRGGMRRAGLTWAVWMISTVIGMGCLCAGASAFAQVATRTQIVDGLEFSGKVMSRSFTANVTDVAGEPVSGGTVTFESGHGSIGSAIVENGQATIRVSNLPPATTAVTAVYNGDEAHAASTASLQATADATSTLPDFSLTATPTSVTVNPGDYATINIVITPLNGFSETVTLSCSGVPSAASCIFSPETTTPLNGAVATSNLQIQTQAASGTAASLRAPGQHAGGSRVAYAVVLPGLLALAGLGALRRRSGLGVIRVIGLVALLAAGSIGLSSCSARYGYLHKPPAANPGISVGTYNITLAAYASNGSSITSHTLNLTLIVK